MSPSIGARCRRKRVADQEVAKANDAIDHRNVAVLIAQVTVQAQ